MVAISGWRSFRLSCQSLWQFRLFNNLATQPEPKPDVSGVDHAIWDYLLKKYVSSGLVNYEGIKKNHLFQEYLSQLGAADPDKLKTECGKARFSV